ncbi:hypothetical protein B7463_g6892, partial [Scytalidium lignicola]
MLSNNRIYSQVPEYGAVRPESPKSKPKIREELKIREEPKIREELKIREEPGLQQNGQERDLAAIKAEAAKIKQNIEDRLKENSKRQQDRDRESKTQTQQLQEKDIEIRKLEKELRALKEQKQTLETEKQQLTQDLQNETARLKVKGEAYGKLEKEIQDYKAELGPIYELLEKGNALLEGLE